MRKSPLRNWIINNKFVQTRLQIRSIDEYIVILFNFFLTFNFLKIDQSFIINFWIGTIFMKEVSPPDQFSTLIHKCFLSTIEHSLDHFETTILNHNCVFWLFYHLLRMGHWQKSVNICSNHTQFPIELNILIEILKVWICLNDCATYLWAVIAL